ncbi:peptidoglycan DD-metalloendopeptidase family protein [Faecalibacter rhinopitheci]|uniref:Peptidoglycan DD-metalloendopeptidase family protein n=1 Tax=Faecalibacter rhinopitheci TaxID=2779678 RepID=A0A8J7FTN3_9FLAO|nr:peptidoglycan DD-metalloendopeptidase family protein [Faecalibacter rhinopitheci]MBF0597567.1 peptidoglycan DD-metalloendopeptidase family protein [Faecalibacter rhinopitheci]
MENNDYKYKSVNVLKDWSVKRLSNIPKTFYYGFLFLCLATVCGGMIGYHFNDSEFAQKASKFKNNQGKLLAELQKIEKEKQHLNEKFKEVEAALSEIEEKDRNIYRTIYDLKVDEDIDSINNEVNNYTAEDIENLLTKIKDEKKSLEEVIRKADVKDKDLTSLPVLKPVADKYLSRVASGYGSRFHPILKVNKMHNGLDFAAATGTPIYATGDGTVKMAGMNAGYGNVVILKHSKGFETLYAHMSRIKARNGQKVKRGDLIGYVGTTGLSTGPHLHYEIHKDGKPVDPLMYFYDDVDPDAFIKIYQSAKKSTLSLD